MALQSRRRTNDPAPTVHRVTSAQEALSQEQSRRARRYLISMTIRTLCFIAAVIAANAGRENDAFTNEPVAPASTVELPATATRIIAEDPTDRS